MGLLSDPEYGTMRLAQGLRKYHRSTCFLCFAGALVWFVALANRNFNNETYFSENALLPGLVTNEFNGERSAKQFYTELLDELQDKYENSPEMPIPWLVGKMSQLHLEVYTHNFTLNYPLGHGEVYSGTNVYGILRAPRTSSLEALVISVPFRPLSSHHKGTAAGLALMLAFAQFARPQKYWAKDIIFLVTEHEQLGMQAWLEAYHGIQSDAGTFYTSLGSFWKPGTFASGPLAKVLDWGGHEKCLNPGKLKGRSGSIQAAINLEFHTPKIKYVEVKVEGLNGQLPNLDLVNLVHKLCIKSNIHHSYKNSYSWIRSRRSNDEWRNNFYTLLSMFTTQLPGVPSGNHGLFHRFGIEALTLEGRGSDDPAGAAPRADSLSNANFYRLGIALESIMRSLNNLLERFHQSYFFYLLAATDRFISIGQYMPSLCLLCVGMLLRALALWVNIHSDEDKEKTDRNTTEKDSESTKHEPVRKEANVNLVNIGLNYLLVHFLGYLVMNSPVLFSRIGYSYGYSAPVSVYSGLCLLSLLLLLTPPLPRLLSPPLHADMSLLNVLALLELATICLGVGMHNFPLGLCVAALMTPVALVASVGRKDGGRVESVKLYTARLICLLSQPLVAATLAISLYSVRLYSDEPVLTALARGRDANMHAVVYSVLDSMIYGNWLFNVVTALVLPTWIIFWQLLCNKVEYPTTPTIGSGTKKTN